MLVLRLAMRCCAPSKERRMQILPTWPSSDIQERRLEARVFDDAIAHLLGRPSAPGRRPRPVARGFSVDAITPEGVRNRNSLLVASLRSLRHQRVHPVAGHQHVEQILPAPDCTYTGVTER